MSLTDTLFLYFCFLGTKNYRRDIYRRDFSHEDIYCSMRFYDREKELAWMAETRRIAFTNHSQMTMLAGRRRIGKTKLVLKSCEGTQTVYLFVDRSNEAALCKGFAEIARQALNVYISPDTSTFAGLFEALMVIGKDVRFNLVVDEFQEFMYINPSIYNQIQNVWDRYKDITKINFIACGSVYTLMQRIFMDYSQPLYGRLDSTIKLQPFGTETLREILADVKPNFNRDDLLALYTFSGGIPKYVEAFIDNGCTDMDSMVDFMMRPNSMFQSEGRMLLVQEFGRKYGNYFTILSAIANGDNTLYKLSSLMGDMSVSGHLKRLEEDYELIVKKRPVMSKEGTQTVRFEISDLFLRFWFRYFIKYHHLVETGNLAYLKKIIKEDYPTYSGMTLEMFFRQKIRESMKFQLIGSWWETTKGKDAEQNEIDIVAIYASERKALVAEVKRQKKNFKPELFAKKVERLRTKLLSNYEIETACLTLEDI